ncbi:MAG TPA: NifB/NifX family molybdenum-iron cluster-binding protein [Verrucomicrobiae bacterium]|nr:NifB/NifX family molybdenum-iron cluster-binding protein [Verrucomicrobiae bacterium]
MTVAIPIWQDRVSPVFDTASRLLVVHHGRAGELGRREIALGSVPSDGLARTVLDLGVDVLLCAAISEPIRFTLERGGVRVEDNLCGEVESLLRAFNAGTWRDPKFQMPGCGKQRGFPGRRSRCQPFRTEALRRAR